MSAAQSPHNVIAFAPYRAARQARRPAMPYLLWYPGVGFVMQSSSGRPHNVVSTARGPQSAA